ncbi:MAG TPA: hypothetical protein ENI92_03365, partial [Bacteroidetes bacterium]|nr:hypothetical protein [Bacteroidota bacterium]
MKLRWRLLLAIGLAGLLPLIPLLLSVRGTVKLGIRTLAPDEIGLSLQSGLQLARRAIASEERALRLRLQEYSTSLPLPGGTVHAVPPRPAAGDSLLYAKTSAGDWWRWSEERWIPS